MHLHFTTKCFIAIFIILPFLVSCSDQQKENITTPTYPQNFQPIKAETVFELEIPKNTPKKSRIVLEIIDDVTGIAFNSKRYEMQVKDDFHYFVNIPLPVGSIVKYRFMRDGNPPAREYNTHKQQVLYRLAIINSPNVIKDTVAYWNDTFYEGEYGRVTGIIRDQTTNTPVPNATINICGISTVSSSSGAFTIDNLAVGEHNLVVYSSAGGYTDFQQGARISAGATTPAEISLSPLPLVKITFVVSIPSVAGNMPLRLIGNLPELGALSGEHNAGMSTIASNAPKLTPLPDGKLGITVKLPAGFDLRYKYSFGDGFWNGELDKSGNFYVRQLIVPEKDTLVYDSVVSFSENPANAISFSLQTPPGDPKGDSVSIQFNPFDWTEPLPMIKKPNGVYSYTLFNPIETLGEFQYRYCRNSICQIERRSPLQLDDTTRKIGLENYGKTITDKITQWNAWDGKQVLLSVNKLPANSKSDTFTAGLELGPDNLPYWKGNLLSILPNIKATGANLVVLTPSWKYVSVNPPAISSVPGHTPEWFDLSRQIRQLKEQGMKIGIFPLLDPQQPIGDFWHNAELSSGWWQTWFDRLSPFLVNYADIANQTGTEILILGDPSMRPSFAGPEDAVEYKVQLPPDSTRRWNDLIQLLRTRYSGKIYWAIFKPEDIDNLPPWINYADGIYLIWNKSFLPINSKPSINSEDLAADINLQLDALGKRVKFPVILRVNIPSATGVMENCLGDKKTCAPIPWAEFSYMNSGAKTNLDEQTKTIELYMRAIDNLNNIAGVVVSGYNPFLRIQDNTASIHGKPGENSVYYWFTSWAHQTK